MSMPTPKERAATWLQAYEKDEVEITGEHRNVLLRRCPDRGHGAGTRDDRAPLRGKGVAGSTEGRLCHGLPPSPVIGCAYSCCQAKDTYGQTRKNKVCSCREHRVPGEADQRDGVRVECYL